MKFFKKNLLSTIVSLLTIVFFNTELSAESIAFGYFLNKSENRGMDYLQQLLPNSLASSLKNKYDIDTVKPGKLDFLNSEKSKFSKKTIEEKDLFEISSLFSESYFVYGNYQPLPDNRIKLNVLIYQNKGNYVFSFTEEGKLETELFKFIDRISYQIKNIASESMLYKSEVLAHQSKISIITNITGEDLNLLYYSFMKNGYRITSVQGNELNNCLDEKQILKLNTVSTTNAYYHIISNRSEIILPHGTWSGKKYYMDLQEQKKIFNKYAFNFENTLETLSKKIINFQPYSFDYFIIIGFDKDIKNAWVRCVSIKNNRLILSESAINGSNIPEISEKIIKSLTSELPKKY